MDHIILDRSGTLRTSGFFELDVLDTDDVRPQARSVDPRHDIVSLRHPTADELFVKRGTSYVSASILEINGSERLHDCSLDMTHVTAQYWKGIKLELSGGPQISDLIVGDLDANRTLLVSDSIATRLRASPFRGYRLVELGNIDYTGSTGISAKTKGFPLHELQFRGKKCLRGLSVVGAPNECPHCGRKPLICPCCGKSEIFCSECDNDGWVAAKNHGGASDKRLISAGWDQWRPLVIDLNRWDGADFVFVTLQRGIYSNVITKRVLDWLLSIHAAPFVARPALARIDGANRDQLRMFEEAIGKE